MPSPVECFFVAGWWCTIALYTEVPHAPLDRGSRLGPVFHSASFTQEEHHHAIGEEEVGSVHFLTSCSPDFTGNFDRAVALLQPFQYEQARQAFTEISDRGPQCAMARWGVAMSHYHGMWDNGDTAAGRLALNQAKQIAAGNAKTTPRESAYIEALAEIYRDDGKEHTRAARRLHREWACCSEFIRRTMRRPSFTR